MASKMRVLIETAKESADVMDKNGLSEQAVKLLDAVKHAEPDPTSILHELGLSARTEGKYQIVRMPDGTERKFLSLEALNEFAHSQRFKKVGHKTFAPRAPKPQAQARA